MTEPFNWFITPHFEANEFRCPCCKGLILDEALTYQLERLRKDINSPINVTSGYRCEKHNKEVGGSKNSFHMKGQAADIMVIGMSTRLLACYADFLFRGVGTYSGHVHVDMGERYARWEK